MNSFDLIDIIELGTTELCNLKCHFCPRSQGYPNQNIHISKDIAIEIRKQLDDCNYSRIVSFAGKGEPTLTKNFGDILEIFTENDPKYQIRIITNGKKLDEIENYFNKIDNIIYNFYDHNLVFFEKERKKYEKYENILVSLANPMLEDENQSLTYEVMNLNYDNDSYDFKSYLGFSNRAGFLKSEINDPKKVHHNACTLLFTKLYISWNGDYYLCCDDWSNKKISNIKDETILEYVENNKILKHYKKYHLTGKRGLLDICKNCTRYRGDARDFFKKA